VSDDFLQANVGLAWSLIYEAELDEQHDFTAPIQVLEMVVKRYPTSPEGWTALGVAHYLHEDVDEARSAFEQALAIDRNYMEAHTGLGQVWMRRGEFAKARAEFETTLRLAPDDVGHYVNLIGAQERMGDDAAALQTVLEGLRIAPEDPRLIVMHGNLMAKHGNLEPALAEFDRVLRADPQSSAAWLAKGKVLSLKRETTGALRAFQNAAQFDTTSFEAHYNAGMMMLSDPSQDPAVAVQFLVRAYEHRGDSAAVAGLRETLMKLSIQDSNAYYTLAMSDALRHDLEPALEWIERALKLKPDYGDALFLKGRILQEKGDREGALTALKKACELLPDSIQAFAWTGDLLAQMGNREDARTYLEKALAIAKRIAPSDPGMKDILPAIEEHVRALTEPKK
jgi:tetratricopeptide (TPR) repeat protein